MVAFLYISGEQSIINLLIACETDTCRAAALQLIRLKLISHLHRVSRCHEFCEKLDIDGTRPSWCKRDRKLKLGQVRSGQAVGL